MDGNYVKAYQQIKDGSDTSSVFLAKVLSVNGCAVCKWWLVSNHQEGRIKKMVDCCLCWGNCLLQLWRLSVEKVNNFISVGVLLDLSSQSWLIALFFRDDGTDGKTG